MRMTSRFVLAMTAVLLFAHATAAHAQRSLAQLRQELVAPWLVTVKGEARDRLLRINEISQDTEGTFVVVGNFGWIDGTQAITRIELIQAAQGLTLIVRTVGDALISVRQSPDGGFAGTFRGASGRELATKLEKLSEDQLSQRAQETSAKLAARVFADEDKDWGVAPTKQPRTDQYHAPTPKELPGAKTIKTMELRALLSQSPAPVLIDALGDDGHRTIAGSHWLKGIGVGVLGNAVTERMRLDLEKLTAGRKSAPLVFFCLSSQCWLSYNAGLHAIGLGYTNIHWYRGGIEAWQRAEFEVRQAMPYQR